MIDLRLGSYLETLADVPEFDALVTDAPYSAQTHAGHDEGVASAAGSSYARTTHGAQCRGLKSAQHETYVVNGVRHKAPKAYDRRTIDYAGWTPDDVRTCVDSLVPRTLGWVVTITDHVLAPVWSEHLARHGRYVFAPLPWVAVGSRVRLAGDGPSSWTCWIVVARPRSGEHRDGTRWSKWGTLPGAYVETADRGGIVAGAKPLALMRALVRDYTRPGDLVCDPCAGGATTALAARAEGRRFIGAELDPVTHAAALERLAEPPLLARGQETQAALL